MGVTGDFVSGALLLIAARDLSPGYHTRAEAGGRGPRCTGLLRSTRTSPQRSLGGSGMGVDWARGGTLEPRSALSPVSGWAWLPRCTRILTRLPQSCEEGRYHPSPLPKSTGDHRPCKSYPGSNCGQSSTCASSFAFLPVLSRPDRRRCGVGQVSEAPHKAGKDGMGFSRCNTGGCFSDSAFTCRWGPARGTLSANIADTGSV